MIYNTTKALSALIIYVSAAESHAVETNFETGSILEVQTYNMDGQIQAEYAFESDVTFRIAQRFTLNAGLVVEPVIEVEDSRILRQEGAFLADLNLTFATSRFSLTAGKLAPDFGTAWDVTPGIFGTDIAEEYELDEKLGLRSDILLGSTGGGHFEASFSLFTEDRSILSRSVIRQRERLRATDAGPGNTGRLDSLSLSLNSFDVFAQGLQLHAAWRRLASSSAAEQPETAYVFGSIWQSDGPFSTEMTFNAEYFRMDNPEGEAGREWIATAGWGLSHGPWRTGASVSRRKTRLDLEPDADRQTQYQLSAGRQIHERAGLDFAVSRETGTSGRSTVFGLQLTIDFSG